MIVKLLLILLLLGIFPLVIGCLWKEESPVASYLHGLAAMLGIFQVLAIPMCALKWKLSLLTKSYLALCMVLVVISVIKNRTFVLQRAWIRRKLRTFSPLLGAAILCMLLQAGYVTKMQHMDADDAFYLATAVTAVENDGLYTHNPNTGRVLKEAGYVRYMLASWPIFIAVLSQTSGLHATVLAHMVLPAIVLMWCYLAFFLFAEWLYPEEKHKEGLFMLFVTVLFTFSGFSVYSSSLFPLIRGWQGKAVLTGMGLPLLLYQSLQAREKASWSLEWTKLLVVCAGVSAFSTIADVLGCIVVGCVMAVSALREKKILRYALHTLAACLPFLMLGGIYLLRMKGRI